MRFYQSKAARHNFRLALVYFIFTPVLVYSFWKRLYVFQDPLLSTNPVLDVLTIAVMAWTGLFLLRVANRQEAQHHGKS
jgi:hypothetical protein